MKILWIWNSNRDEPFYHRENDGASFRKHDECMRMFRLAHPNIETTKSKGVGTTDWLALIPIQNVKLARCSQN